MAKPNWIALRYMSTEQIELAIECSYHPELNAKLVEEFADAEFNIKLAAVAAYCEVIVDGLYDPEDLNKLCDTLTNRLRQKRSLIVLPSARLLQ